MAKQTTSTGSIRKNKPKVKRKGISAKAGSSKNKNSKNYKKPYKSQGR